MKKLPLILSIISLAGVVAVAVLSLVNKTGVSSNGKLNSENGSGEIKIAYIQTDSVLVNYNLAIDLHKDYMSQQQQYNSEFGRKRESLERQAAAFQEKLQRGGFLTEERAMNERDKILGQEEEIRRMDYELSNKLGQMEASINQRLADSIVSYVKEYNKKHNYTYILSNSGNIVVGDQKYNITKDILDGLNSRYSSLK
jgi:outer membrane protein